MVYWPLELEVGAMKKAHINALCTLKYLCSVSVIKWYQYVCTSV